MVGCFAFRFSRREMGRQSGWKTRWLGPSRSGAGEGETRVVILDLENLRVAKVLETGNRPKHGLVSPDGRRVGVDHWALSGGKLRLTFIRTEDDTIEKVLDIPVTNQPKGVTSMHNAWSWDSRYFFSVDRVDDRLVVVDTADWSVRAGRPAVAWRSVEALSRVPCAAQGPQARF